MKVSQKLNLNSLTNELREHVLFARTKRSTDFLIEIIKNLQSLFPLTQITILGIIRHNTNIGA